MRCSVTGDSSAAADVCRVRPERRGVGELCPSDSADGSPSDESLSICCAVALMALPTLPLPLPLLGCSLIRNERAHPEACSSAASATISALSASLCARVRLWTGFSTMISLPFVFSRPISVSSGENVAAGVLR